MKNIIYFLVVIVLMASCSSEPHYIVKGRIDGSDTITFYLLKKEGKKIIAIDSAISKKGAFKMKGGAVDYPQLIQLVAGKTRMSTSFYLENSEITITGSLDSLFKAKISGSKTQDEYQSFINSNKPISEEYSKAYMEIRAARQSGDNVRAAELRRHADSLGIRLKNLQKDFVKNHPSSYASPSILMSLSSDMEGVEIESMINELDTAIAAIPQIKKLKERAAIMKTVAVGQKAHDFTMNDVDGKPVSLSSKIGSKLLLIDFWASWCNPCRQENPNVVRVYTEFHKKGFDIFGVSLDTEKDRWIKAISDDKLTWTHVSDLNIGDNSSAIKYAVYTIPCNYLVDETGTIIARNLKGEALYNKINEILGEKK